MKKYFWLLFGLLLLAAALPRLWDINSLPPHLSNDEISIAYDAYSLVRTGRDEHQALFPVSFQSHGTYKAPLYAYLLAPLTFFPRNDLVARLPSVISGLLTVLCLFYLAYSLTQNFRIAWFSALVLAFTPWHIYTSRMVLEANVALLFLCLGLVIFFRNLLSSNGRFLLVLLSGLFLVLSMYGYHTEWGLTPVLIILLSVFIFKKSGRQAILFLAFCLFLTLPLIAGFITDLHTGARANTEVIWQAAGLSAQLNHHASALVKFLIISKSFIGNYISFTNPGYLFFSGLDLFPSPGPFQFGLFLWPLVLPFFLGLFSLRLISGKFLRFFIAWLILSLVVPALTHDANFIRNLTSVLPYTILISLGLTRLRLTMPWIFTLILFTGLVVFAFFAPLYFVHYPLIKAETYEGYRPLAGFLRNLPATTPVIVDYRFGRYSQYSGVPYLYFGYYNSWNPRIIQTRLTTDNGWYYGNYRITWIDWNRQPVAGNTIYIVPASNPPVRQIRDRLKLLRSFVDAAGSPSFEIWQGI